MATNRECDCITFVSKSISDASSLKELGAVALHFGNLKFERTKFPAPIKSDKLHDIIKDKAISLKGNLDRMESICKTVPSPDYTSGKEALRKAIDKNSIQDSFNAGYIINHSLLDTINSRKLFRCAGPEF